MQDTPYTAYYRVSTDRQGRSGLGLKAQQRAGNDTYPESTPTNSRLSLGLVRSGSRTLGIYLFEGLGKKPQAKNTDFGPQ